MRRGLALAALLAACGTPSGAPPERALERPASDAPASERALERPASDVPAPPRRGPERSASEGPALPDSAPTRGRPGPWTEERVLENAAYDEPGAPSVIVHAPPGFDPGRPLRLVVFLHGYSGCARVLVGIGSVACKDGGPPRPGWDLAGRFDEAGSDALFVVPQLAFLRREGDPGRFAREGGFRAFVGELLAALEGPLAGARLEDVERVSLLAHSAGFESAMAILGRGGIEVNDVVLFDALYAGTAVFARWVAGDPGRRLVSLYTGGGQPARQSRRLAGLLRGSMGEGVVYDREGPLPEVVREFRVVIARSPARHGEVPARHLAALLPALGLSGR